VSIDERSPRRIEAIYERRPEASEILLYGGLIEVETDSVREAIEGQVELRLSPRSTLIARVAGPASQLFRLGWPIAPEGVRLPPDASLNPPRMPPLPAKPESASRGGDKIIISQLESGELSTATRLVIHVSRSILRPRFRGLVQMADGTRQGQVNFRLDGWDLVLVAHESDDDRDFGAVIEATRPDPAIDSDAVDALAHRLFILLSFVSSREVGVGPICALNDEGTVVWTLWTTPRLRAGKAPAGWCARHVMPDALPELGTSLSTIEKGSAKEAVLERAINYLLFADSDEVLDVRVTMACAGLELLSWAVLRDEGWLEHGSPPPGRLSAGASVRLLLERAQICTDLPHHCDALIARQDRMADPTVGAAEMIFIIRNRVVHPPKNVDDPEWPGGEELYEAWKLATWSLELVLLRLLDYDGPYWPRLQMPRPEMNVEPVPWATQSPRSGTTRG
jgi:hypothetical protein